MKDLNDHNDLEVIINNQRIIMAALAEHLMNTHGDSLAVVAINMRLEDLDKRAKERFGG